MFRAALLGVLVSTAVPLGVLAPGCDHTLGSLSHDSNRQR
jgi:hypothetical protein